MALSTRFYRIFFLSKELLIVLCLTPLNYHRLDSSSYHFNGTHFCLVFLAWFVPGTLIFLLVWLLSLLLLVMQLDSSLEISPTKLFFFSHSFPSSSTDPLLSVYKCAEMYSYSVRSGNFQLSIGSKVSFCFI